MTEPQTPELRAILRVLSKDRLVQVGRRFNVAVTRDVTRESQVTTLLASGRLDFHGLLRSLGRDELRTACRAHGLDARGRSRADLARQLADAVGVAQPHDDDPVALFGRQEARRYTPREGDVVQVRQRQYLVAAVEAPAEDDDPAGPHTRVDLVCLDDDNQGRRLTVFWELELGARVLQPETHGLGTVGKLDPPRLFAAYLHALKWNVVTATDARLFQAPFRAGISLDKLVHQLTPLKKALELPRANLLIADDVGLGKTIEAGLVVQELRLRQRLDYVVVVCPAAICLQWRDEMARRFGLHFEIYNRDFVARRRRQRGYSVNPWSTHNRFVISYQTIRRPEYRDPLLNYLEKRGKKKSLLVLDEAHTAAPATASKYAVDSSVTRVVRDVARRFENRLFLTATPHNGHSNSFSALLEILDRQRFTRGIRVGGREELEPVMVRRLKSDLRAIASGDYKKRHVVEIVCEFHDGQWTHREIHRENHRENHRESGGSTAAAGSTDDAGFTAAAELRLSELLAEYAELLSPAGGKRRQGRGHLVFIRLQKRLLSSIRAFDRTLNVHADNVGKKDEYFEKATAYRVENAEENEEYGVHEDAEADLDDAEDAASSRDVATPAGRAREILREMQRLAARHRDLPDAKVLALVDWIRREMCSAVAFDNRRGSKDPKNIAWNDRRVIVFTEYGDTRHYLRQILGAAVEGTDRADERILQFYGGMSDERRDEIQSAFVDPDHPVRVLIATDAAREGVNLQGQCSDLFHFDVPWNPARMEQRNGRIDRTLQQKDVTCRYFVFPQRAEDLVLRKLVQKVEVIQRELGSLSSVIFEQIHAALDEGISTATGEALERASTGRHRDTVEEECESLRIHERLKAEVDEAGTLLAASRRVLGFQPRLLHRAVDAGLALAGIPPLEDAGKTDDGIPILRLPEMPDSWQETVDPLRPTRRRGEEFWEWRRKEPRPVVFKGLRKLDASLAQLHLEHPFVKRILSRFLSQGYSAHDLSRVTAVRNPEGSTIHVLAFGRLTLFGSGATRLHDEVVHVAARWLLNQGKDHLKPYAEARSREIFQNLEGLLEKASAPELPRDLDLRASAPGDLSVLWPHVRAEADALAHRAEEHLAERGAAEAEALRRLLLRQRRQLKNELSGKQLTLDFGKADDALNASEKAQRKQLRLDRDEWEKRLLEVEDELENEPAQIEELYRVVRPRLEPVGLVYLWPGMM